MDGLDFMKIKNFYVSKNTVNKENSQDNKKKDLKIIYLIRELVSRIY